MAHLCPPPPRLSLMLLLVLVSAALAAASHECERTCEMGDTRYCHYDFNVQDYYTMSRACYSCPDNLDDCSRDECIAADGASIPLKAVNRQLPGPSIQVCYGDSVVVDLHNGQLSDTETLHFHGFSMVNYQYNDGVPYLTQCPVLATSFRYNFTATSRGTNFWHSHVGLHRSSGIFGSLVVREVEDPHRGLYDLDLPEHVLVMSDWDHSPIQTTFWANHHAGVFAYPKNILINGKGRDPTSGVLLPLEVVNVKPGLRHRLRIVDGGGGDCPMMVSVDGHRLTIIAMDGTNIVPFTTDSFIMISGERYDVILEADQPVDNYWIRVNGLVLCGVAQVKQGAILRYEGAPEKDPDENLLYQPNPIGVTVNPLQPDPDSPNLVSVVSLDILDPGTLDEPVDKTFYLAFNFNAVNATPFFNPELYPYNRVPDKFKAPTVQVNGISFMYPEAPPLSQPDAPQPTLCLYGEEPPCDGDYCACTYVLEVALWDWVEIILVDEGDYVNSTHPFHLHGNSFSVVAMEHLGDKTSVAEVKALDEAGKIHRRLLDTVRKDTVNIPHGGYTIIRFPAVNPGWWAMHCHIVDHSEMGMVGVLHVGTKDDLPPVPDGFPTCGPFMP